MSNTVLITGTSTGLGRATAKLFQERGWNVIATMRAVEHETELIQLESTLVTRLDVQDPASIRAAVQAGLDRFGRIDALINNAGYGAYGPLELTPPEKIQRQFEVNVLGLLATTQAVLPHFRENRNGVVVNISSIGGRLAFPLGSLYHGTKFAVEGLSESLYYELGTLGIRVKVVEPGGIKTDFGGRSLDFSNDPAADEYQALVQGVIGTLGPMMENGSTPGAIADVVYNATTDDTDQLRYRAGPDAEQMIAGREASGGEKFLAGMKALFGLYEPVPAQGCEETVTDLQPAPCEQPPVGPPPPGSAHPLHARRAVTSLGAPQRHDHVKRRWHITRVNSIADRDSSPADVQA